MSVRVTDTSGTLWQIAHDEGDHTGEADPSTFSYGQNIDGTENRDIIVIPCPLGDGVSFWPRESVPDMVRDRMPA